MDEQWMELRAQCTQLQKMWHSNVNSKWCYDNHILRQKNIYALISITISCPGA